MTNYERRLTRLETQMDVHENGMAWADVHHALQRQTARARLTLCQRLDVDPRDPRVVEAVTGYVRDTCNFQPQSSCDRFLHVSRTYPVLLIVTIAQALLLLSAPLYRGA